MANGCENPSSEFKNTELLQEYNYPVEGTGAAAGKLTMGATLTAHMLTLKT